MKNPQVVLITGASRGLGAALARHYARQGRMLALTGRDAAQLQVVADLCRGQGAHVLTKTIDVTDRAALQSWIETIDDEYTIDLVIANAGISGGTGGGQRSELSAQAYRIFDVNLTGVLNTISPLLPRMAQRRRGQIAVMSSLASFGGWAGAPSYSASKGAVRLYGEALRGAYRNTGVQVNVICPGFVRTAMTDVNDFPMPFLMEADRAAKIMAMGLARNKARIAFPFATYLAVGLIGMMPAAFMGWLIRHFPQKPACIE